MELYRLKLGIVGCGAVTELFHLPALTKLPSVNIFALVDSNRERAKAMTEKFCLNRYHTNYEDIFGEVDIALIALPNHLHARPTIDFLRHDIHVLCEKPMATSVKECESMIEASRESKAKLMIGHNKRFMSNVILAKKMIDNGSLGKITGYDCKVGAVFRWPTQTGFYFKKDEAGGGTLIDMGVHVIDLLFWYFGEAENIKYQARDIMGKGVEDNVSMSLSHNNSIKGRVTLSRTELLDNKLIIKGKDGWVKIDMFDTTSLEFNSKKAKASSELGKLQVRTKNNDSYRDQFAHFVGCIKSDIKPLISGTDGMKVIQAVEECYKQA